MQRTEIDLQRAKSAEILRLERGSTIFHPEAWEAKADEASYQESLLRVEEAKNSRQEELLTIGLAFIKDARSENAFSKLSRYEAGIERSLYRAIHELQRLQAKRKGDEVSAPVVVDVTGDQGLSA